MAIAMLLFAVACNKNQAPDEPEAVTPTNGATGIDFSNGITLSWKCSDPDEDIISFDVYFGITQDPPLVSADQSSKNYTVTNLNEETTYFWKIVAKDDEKQSESDVYSFTTKAFDIEDVKCIDYDGNEYAVVQIGNQIWMAEDLRSLHYSDGTAIPNVLAYNNQEDLVQYYGRLYNWTSVMNGESSSNANPSGVHGIAPEGWHVPSKAEWEELIAYLGGNAVAGGKMKETGYDYWADPNTGATNESGFNGRGCGWYSQGTNPNFTNLWYDVLYWTSMQDQSNSAFFTALANNVSEIYLPTDGLGITINNITVRCIKD